MEKKKKKKKYIASGAVQTLIVYTRGRRQKENNKMCGIGY